MTLEAGKMIESRRRILFPLEKQFMKLRRIYEIAIRKNQSSNLGFSGRYLIIRTIQWIRRFRSSLGTPFSKLIVAINATQRLTLFKDASLELRA